MSRTARPPAITAIGASILIATALAGCQPTASNEPASDYITEGKLTIATGEPAFYPWVIDDAPESGEGFEAAIAYAVAEELGFAEDDVVWVRTDFESVIAPGPKTFDFNIQQFSITEDRAEVVDFSTPYYETTQVVITTAESPAAEASSTAPVR